MIPKSSSKQVCLILDGIIGSGMRSVYLEGNGPASGLFVPPDWFFFWSENYGWFCSVLKQSSHQVPQNLAFEFLLQSTKILDHPLNQPSPRKCGQEYTSVLNLIFQQANVAGVGNFSKWRSEICSHCWSAPSFFEESPSLGMTEFLADGPDWHRWSWTDVWFSLSSPVLSEFVVIFQNSMDSIPADKVLKKTQLDLQKRFPIYHVCPKSLAAHFCGSAFL